MKNFFNNLSIVKKIATLIATAAIGTLLIGGVAHFGVNSMKDKYNLFYDKYFATIQTLDKVQMRYSTNIQCKLLEIQKSEMEPEKIVHNILSSKENGLKNWKNFLSLHYQYIDKKDIQQHKIVDTIQEQIVGVNKQLENSMLVLQKEGKETFADIAFNPMLQSINQLDTSVSTLIAYQYKLANKEKENISHKYEDTQLIVFIMTALVLLTSLFFTLMITKNFQKMLLDLSRVVERRNTENEKMQALLESRVDEAVEKAREQDQIMFQHARLASMGEMIGNIAHQWRQPLNALTLLIQSFGTKSLSGKLNQDFIDKQVDEGMRLAVAMSDTIEDFRNFFSPSKEKEHFDVSKSIHDTLEMSSFFCKDENIDIQVQCDSDIKVYGYSNEFSQVILNFINNARDNFKHKEIDEDKKIKIVVKKASGKEPMVEISFADNGGGVEEHIIDRVFEPYFTTKHKATGTGIGLYMSKQIIETQMGGEVMVRNVKKEFDGKSYKCAEFKIVVPVEVFGSKEVL